MVFRRRSSCKNINKVEGKSCWSTPTVYHAAIVIFLEFFAFGLLTTPMITVLNETFPTYTFLMNGLIYGIKGFLSFFGAPFVGALSDSYGRKPFLLLTVTFTCCPIPLMKISHWWYFTLISISGIFAVTFSVVLAYVADITSPKDRSWSYGLVSATFAASLVSSPAIGAYIGQVYSQECVVALATIISILDIGFIILCVPESLPEKVRSGHICSVPTLNESSNKFSWGKADPFSALKQMTDDYLVLIICITTFLSYLPEAGQYTCFFVYLRLVVHFTEQDVALFIALVGIMSCLAQTLLLSFINRFMNPKRVILLGLFFEAIQLSMYGFCTEPVLLWIAGIIAAMGSITYPALSSFISNHAAVDQQGVAQGLITGIRGLCGGLGPALFGLFFYMFRVDLNNESSNVAHASPNESLIADRLHELIMPGPPFAFGSIFVLLAILVALFIPEYGRNTLSQTMSESADRSNNSHGYWFGETRLRRSSPLPEIWPNPTNNTSTDSTYHKALTPVDSKVVNTVRYSHYDPRRSWNRLFGNWFISERLPALGTKPAIHLSPKKPIGRTVRQASGKSTGARIVEPLRRLFVGRSNHPADSQLIPHDKTSHQPLLLDMDVDYQFLDGGSYLKTNAINTNSCTEAEAADLSNYRSNQFAGLLNTLSHQSNEEMAFIDQMTLLNSSSTLLSDSRKAIHL